MNYITEDNIDEAIDALLEIQAYKKQIVPEMFDEVLEAMEIDAGAALVLFQTLDQQIKDGTFRYKQAISFAFVAGVIAARKSSIEGSG